MGYQITVSDSYLMLVLDGDIDLQITAELKQELNTAFEHHLTAFGPKAGIIIDASDVSYIDSSGVAILLLARMLCSQASLEFRISAVSAAAQHIITAAKLEAVLRAEHILPSDAP